MSAPVIDFHIHVMPTDSMDSPVGGFMRNFISEPLENYLARVCTPQGTMAMMDEWGVEYGVILAEQSPLTCGLGFSSREAAEFCQDNPRLIPFANINPYLTLTPARDLERDFREYGVRGVKMVPTYQLYYPNDKLVYPVYAVAEEMGLPVMFHTGTSVFETSRTKYGDPLTIEDLAVDFPDLTLVMSHSGRGWWTETAAHLARTYRNVYMEIAGFPPQNLLRYFPDLEGLADKVIFGSDWPSQPFTMRNVKGIKELPISEDAKAMILGGTAAKILGLPVTV